jgi:hypothetical protein
VEGVERAGAAVARWPQQAERLDDHAACPAAQSADKARAGRQVVGGELLEAPDGVLGGRRVDELGVEADAVGVP